MTEPLSPEALAVEATKMCSEQIEVAAFCSVNHRTATTGVACVGCIENAIEKAVRQEQNRVTDVVSKFGCEHDWPAAAIHHLNATILKGEQAPFGGGA